MKILVTISILFCLSIKAQIFIDASCSASGRKFNIEIKEDSTHYFVKLKIPDSVKKSRNYEQEMKIYQENFSKIKDFSVKNDSVIEVIQKMKILTEKNTIYSVYETVFMKEDGEFKKFGEFVKMFNTTSYLKHFERVEQNRNRVVFDGVFVKVTVINDKDIKTIWANSPSPKSHPEIYNLITSAVSILRDKGILSKNKICSYGG